MDMNFLYAILIALAPVVLTIIISRAYNIVHGLITFLVFGYVLLFCLGEFGDKLPEQMQMYLGLAGLEVPLPFGTLALYQMIHMAVLDLMGQIGLEKLLLNENLKYFILAGCAVIFIISQIIASKIRKSRVAKVRKLRRYLKRY